MNKYLVSAVALAALAACGVSVGAQRGVGERVGQRIDRAVGQLREEAKDVAGQLQESFEQARQWIDRMGVTGRVYARLHWDKALNTATISVDVDRDGVAVLHGNVPSDEARRKAEELASSTVGVNRVANELSVAPAEQAAGRDGRPR